jgi:hypothetical protein
MSLSAPLQLTQEPFSSYLPPTLESAATISPTTAVSFITGTEQLETIVPPIPAAHVLLLIFLAEVPGIVLTSGNIAAAVTPIQNTAMILAYEPRTKKYYPNTNAANALSPSQFMRAVVAGVETGNIVTPGITTTSTLTFVLEFVPQGFGFEEIVDQTGNTTIPEDDAIAISEDTAGSSIVVFWIAT